MNKENWFLKYMAGSRKGSMREGVLMRLEENEHSRYEFEVWFEYTRQAMSEIKEGTMLVVPNYATSTDEIHSSVIQVTSLKPIHYAIGEKPEGFPGFVIEAAKNAAKDWTGQDDEPTEDTTTIRCTAIPTNLELVERKDGSLCFQSEENIPMAGALVRILTTEPTSQVVNRDINIELEKDNLFEGGVLIRDEKVPVYVRIEDLIRVHFGIFGFTGSGKSNLLSTYISNLLSSKQKVKVVLYDLMGEYTVLLLDQLLNDDINSSILNLGRETLPEDVFKYINSQEPIPSLDKATERLTSYNTLLPKALLPHRKKVNIGFRKLLENKTIWFFNQAQSLSVYDVFFTDTITWSKDRKMQKWTQRRELVKRCLAAEIKGDYKKVHFTPELARKIREAIELELELPAYAEFRKDGDFVNHLTKLEELEASTAENFAAGVTIDDVVNDLSDNSHSSLWIIQAHDPDQLRLFSSQLGRAIYENRRRTGNINPVIVFIYDEADEFIPLAATGSLEVSKKMVETLARRGRKFGLGVGIATQRTRYLDTSIMAQLHTYLVSKLPREVDRAVVAEAYGISEDMFRQTFKFRPGNWLIMSHDATGLKAVPIPIQTEDANERLIAFLETLK